MYRIFEFDITALALPGAANTSPSKSSRPAPTIWPHLRGLESHARRQRHGSLSATSTSSRPAPSPCAIPQVVTHLTGARPMLISPFTPDLTNASAQPLEGTLKASIGAIAARKSVHLGAAHPPHHLSPEEESVPHHRASQPLVAHGLGGPDSLPPAHGIRNRRRRLRPCMGAHSASAKSPRSSTSKGIVVFTSMANRILIRGGGWTHDMLLRPSTRTRGQRIRYARDMHLNALRLEGKMITTHFYDTCDREGMMVMPGWCCCSSGSAGAIGSRRTIISRREPARPVAPLAQSSQRLRLPVRQRQFPHGTGRKRLPPGARRKNNWPNPIFLPPPTRATTVAGPRRQNDRPLRLCARRTTGFSTRTAAAPSDSTPRPARSRRSPSREPAADAARRHLWPIDDFWNFHAGGGGFERLTSSPPRSTPATARPRHRRLRR